MGVETAQGEIRCEYVSNAAGYYAREVGKMLRPRRADDGDEPSVRPFRTDPELAAWSKEAGHKLRSFADVDSSYISARRNMDESRAVREELPRSLGEAR